jgi:hypothetical protein
MELGINIIHKNPLHLCTSQLHNTKNTNEKNTQMQKQGNFYHLNDDDDDNNICIYNNLLLLFIIIKSIIRTRAPASPEYPVSVCVYRPALVRRGQ